MKSKILFLFPCTLTLCMLVNFRAICQQTVNATPVSTAPILKADGSINPNYTYKLFVAPNKLYGYDIFQNGKIIFHQPALAEPAGDKSASLNKKSDADKAARLAIDKIKTGMSPVLSRQEMMQIISGK